MNMKKIFKINVIIVLTILLGFVSCTKDFEEMNINPNQPVDVPSTNILTNSIRYFGQQFFNDWQNMNNFASYAGHITKIQYIDEARYNEREGVVNNAWRDYYNVMLDLQKIIDKSAADEDNTPNMKAVALTFQMYLLHLATDTWKAIPWSQALQGESGITNPAYDSQEEVYNAILSNLKAANDMFDFNPNTADDLGVGDILFNGDVAKWQKFNNSLRLRVAIRMSNVNPTLAGQHLNEIFSNPATYPVMETNDDNAFLYWPGAAPYYEPFYNNTITRDDHGMCITLIDYLKQYNDPRLPVYAHPGFIDDDGNPVYTGIPAGAIDGTFRMDTVSRIGAMYRDDPQGFTPFMRAAEVYFIMAEAANRGLATTPMSAQQAYEEGIKVSMYMNGISDDGAIAAYTAQSMIVWNGDNNRIYMQKWIALFKDGHEAWAESRRTDVPSMGPAPGSPYTGHNRQPFRYPYPTSEFNLNGSNISQVTGGIIDQFWGQQMWWDTRTGVQ
jgi:hypothetical protein